VSPLHAHLVQGTLKRRDTEATTVSISEILIVSFHILLCKPPSDEIVLFLSALATKSRMQREGQYQ
jgi:hypothetical protein